jgi:carbon monoxide dehydrogenase subunit G
MATIRHHTRIDASPDEVWSIISDPAGLGDWAPGIDSVEWDGTTRTISMGGLKIAEEVVTSDADLRRFQYRITDSPMEIGYHLATVDVFDDGQDRTFLVYSCEIEPDDAAGLMGPVLGGLVDALKAKAEG